MDVVEACTFGMTVVGFEFGCCCFGVADVVGSCVVVFVCDVVVIGGVIVLVGCFVSCCCFWICIGVELHVEECLVVMSFGSVTCICNGRGLSPSSIGVVSWSVWFDCGGGAEYDIVSVIVVDCC